MYRKYCDRCGKLIRIDEDYQKYSIRSKEDGGHIDLCSKCETEFEIWLNPTLEPWDMFGKGDK